MTLAGRDFMKLLDYSKEEIQDILNVAKRLKKEKKEAVRRYPHGEACAGKNIVLIFEKASTRTRCAFEVAAADLGVHSTMLDMSTSQMGKKDSLLFLQILSSAIQNVKSRLFVPLKMAIWFLFMCTST